MSHRFTTPFGPESTAAEVIAGVDLSGRRAIVTGGSSGLGTATALALASANAEVTLGVRDVGAGHRAADGIIASTGNKQVLVAPLDLADQGSVAAFAASWSGPLHMLVNNAGIMATPELRTAQGWELQFATNHLGHFALALGLHDALVAAGTARIVSVSSVGHINGEVRFDDIHFQRHPYDPWQAYSQSKTANVLFAVEADRRWAADGIRANALTPGRIRTGLMRYVENEGVGTSPAAFQAGNTEIAWKTVDQGAATSVLLAASPLLDGIGGRYFEDCDEAAPVQPGIRRGVAAYALDPEKAARLWQVSLDTIGSADTSARGHW
jgi:NAD(P)-dependent dehydrogenase (short-subunit alcohol dehydrogenase family)